MIDMARGVAGGKADEAIGAAVDLIKELRQRRLERKSRSSGDAESGVLQPIDESNEETSKPQAPRRPLRDALKNILGGSPSGG